MRWVLHRHWPQSMETIIIIIMLMITRSRRWSARPWVDRMPSVCIGNWRNTKSVKQQMMCVSASCVFEPSWTIRYEFNIYAKPNGSASFLFRIERKEDRFDRSTRSFSSRMDSIWLSNIHLLWTTLRSVYNTRIIGSWFNNAGRGWPSDFVVV